MCAGKARRLNAINKLACHQPRYGMEEHAEFGPSWVAVLPEAGLLGLPGGQV